MTRNPDETGPPPKRTPESTPRRGWERITARQTQDKQTRQTFRPNAPSPSEEILALHDDELDADEPQDEADEEIVDLTDSDDQVFCF